MNDQHMISSVSSSSEAHISSVLLGCLRTAFKVSFYDKTFLLDLDVFSLIELDFKLVLA